MFFNGAFPTRQGPMTNPYYTRSFSRRWPPESDNDNHHQQQVILAILTPHTFKCFYVIFTVLSLIHFNLFSFTIFIST